MASQERIEDAGEKIGGARKDFYKNALSQADLEQMNNQEKVEFITRDNIWPSKPLEVFQQEEVDCDVALFIRALRNAIPKQITDPDHAATFYEFVAKLRDSVTHLKTSDEINIRAGEPSQLEKALIGADIFHLLQSQDPFENHTECRLSQQYKTLLQSYPKGCKLGLHLENLPSFFARSKASYNHHALWDEDKDTWLFPSRMNSKEMYEFIQKLNEKSQLKRKHTQALAANEKKEPNTYLSRPHLDHVQRTGLPDEREGRDIKPDDFLEAFGFRACEFGNWLPQSERQDVLNRAYDAFCTLARILNIDKTFLSLNGSLALAFGSRGKGKALAHYEPARKVINLTRLKGAGYLAHEFFHALDHHLGIYLQTEIKTLDSTELRGLPFATRFLWQLKENQLPSDYADLITTEFNLVNRNKCFEPLISTVNALFTRPGTESEAKVSAEGSVRKICHQMRYAIRDGLQKLLVQPNNKVRNSLANVADQVTKDICEEIKKGRRPGILMIEENPAIKQLLEIIHIALDSPRYSQAIRPIQPIINMLFNEYQTATNREALLQSAHMKETFHTQYFRDAQTLDKRRSKPYWATPHEIAARGFETYVQDSCAELDWRDDYLVHGTEEERFLKYEASPYPMTQDRKRIRAAFNDFTTFLRCDFYPSLENENNETQPSTHRPRMA